MKADEQNAQGVAARQPFIYSVASTLHQFVSWPREKQLALWRRVVDLYKADDRELPEDLGMLCQASFIEDLLENEVFWGLAGEQVNRLSYAHATEFLPTVYAAAAWLAATRDQLVQPGDLDTL